MGSAKETSLTVFSTFKKDSFAPLIDGLDTVATHILHQFTAGLVLGQDTVCLLVRTLEFEKAYYGLITLPKAWNTDAIVNRMVDMCFDYFEDSQKEKLLLNMYILRCGVPLHSIEGELFNHRIRWARYWITATTHPRSGKKMAHEIQNDTPYSIAGSKHWTGLLNRHRFELTDQRLDLFCGPMTVNNSC